MFNSSAVAFGLLNFISFAPPSAAVPHQLVLNDHVPLILAGKHDLVPSHVLDYLEDVRKRWGVKGAGFAVVEQDGDGEWQTETFGLGEKDAEGNPVDENVSHCHTPLELQSLSDARRAIP